MCAWHVRAYGSPAFVYDQVSACMHTRVHGTCVSESPLGWEERAEGGSGIYPFVKGSPHPKATSCHRPAGAPEGHRGPPPPFTCQCVCSSPRRPAADTPSYSGVPPRPSAALPRAGGAGPGPSAPASEGQRAPWPGRRSSAGRTQGHTPSSPRVRGGWAGKAGEEWAGGLNRCLGPDGSRPGGLP